MGAFTVVVGGAVMGRRTCSLWPEQLWLPEQLSLLVAHESFFAWQLKVPEQVSVEQPYVPAHVSVPEQTWEPGQMSVPVQAKLPEQESDPVHTDKLPEQLPAAKTCCTNTFSAPMRTPP
jgi:hypothetical protein